MTDHPRPYNERNGNKEPPTPPIPPDGKCWHDVGWGRGRPGKRNAAVVIPWVLTSPTSFTRPHKVLCFTHQWFSNTLLPLASSLAFTIEYELFCVGKQKPQGTRHTKRTRLSHNSYSSHNSLSPHKTHGIHKRVKFKLTYQHPMFEVSLNVVFSTQILYIFLTVTHYSIHPFYFPSRRQTSQSHNV